MRNITSYPREEIEQGLAECRNKHEEKAEGIRLLFAPEVIDEDNFERACEIYSRVDPTDYDTVVVVESYDQILSKKLPMPSNANFETPLGQVPVNDYMRNEFCDEDDDFYIHDEAFDQEASLFQQLMFLQTLSDDFSAVSIQIADDNPAIIKELAYVLEEVLASRNVLLIFCCELDNTYKEEFNKVKELIDRENISGLLNHLNSGASNIKGITSFIAGLIVARKWNVNLTFLEEAYDQYSGNLLTGFADRQRVFFS